MEIHTILVAKVGETDEFVAVEAVHIREERVGDTSRVEGRLSVHVQRIGFQQVLANVIAQVTVEGEEDASCGYQ
jgi:hypothetical protein